LHDRGTLWEENNMGKFLGSFAIAAALLALSGIDANAGSLTIDSGQPSFSPSNAFSNNSLSAQVVGGNLVQVFGNTDIAITPGGSAMIGITGTFSAAQGDVFSFFYNFSVNLNSTGPVQVTLQGSVGPFSINDTFTLSQGLHSYSGMKQTSPSPIALSGNYQGTATFDFTNVTNLYRLEGAATNTMSLSIPQNGLEFQLGPTGIPEPSTYALLVFSLAISILAARRHRFA
jgi:hypothetical protein